MKNITSTLFSISLLLCFLLFETVSGKEINNEGVISIPFKISDTGHPIILLNYKNKDIRILLDTGAGANILSLKTARKLKLQLKASGVKAAGVGANSHSMVNLDPLKVSYKGYSIVIRDLFSMNLSHSQIAGGKKGFDGILGSPFFQKHKAIFNYETNQLSFKK